MMWSGLKILITGGAGYLGSVLSDFMISNGFKVSVLDNFQFWNGNTSFFSNRNIKCFKGDLTDYEFVDTILSNNKFDVIIHLSGIVGDPACALNPELTNKVNVLAFENLVSKCKKFGVNNFILASSCSVYGSQPNQVLDESSKTNPVSLYAETKLKNEEFLNKSCDSKFKGVSLRMSTLYGWSPRMRYDLVINTFAGNLAKGLEINVSGGNQFRPFIHVSDAAKLYARIAFMLVNKTSLPFIINLVGENKRIIEIAELLRIIKPSVKINVSEDSLDVRNYFVVSKVLNRRSGRMMWKREWKISRGLREVYDNTINLGYNPSQPIFNNYLTLKEVLKV